MLKTLSSFFFVGLKPFRNIRTIAGQWNVGQQGGTVVLGEMDVVRESPYRFGQGQPPVHPA